MAAQQHSNHCRVQVFKTWLKGILIWIWTKDGMILKVASAPCKRAASPNSKPHKHFCRLERLVTQQRDIYNESHISFSEETWVGLSAADYHSCNQIPEFALVLGTGRNVSRGLRVQVVRKRGVPNQLRKREAQREPRKETVQVTWWRELPLFQRDGHVGSFLSDNAIVRLRIRCVYYFSEFYSSTQTDFPEVVGAN